MQDIARATYGVPPVSIQPTNPSIPPTSTALIRSHTPKTHCSGSLCFKQQVATWHSLEGQVAEHSPLYGTNRRHPLSPPLKPEPQLSLPLGKAVTKSVPSLQERPCFSSARSMGHMHQHTPPATSRLRSTSECGIMLFPCYPAPNLLYSNKCCQLYIEKEKENVYWRVLQHSCSCHSVKAPFSCCFARLPLPYETHATQISKSFSTDFSKYHKPSPQQQHTSALTPNRCPNPSHEVPRETSSDGEKNMLKFHP